MNFFDFFIRRPVLTWMFTLSLIVFGVLGYQRLGVDQFPDMDFPVVTVTAVLEGASPEVVEEDVTDVLEEYLNTIAGVRSIDSTTVAGSTRIAVEFELEADIDVAAQDVRDKIALARHDLPEDVEPPMVAKEDFGDEPVLWLPINSDRPIVEASEYVKRAIKPRLETIPGVASAVLLGAQDRSIRIWLDGEELRARGLAAADILAAVRREHVDVPGGRVKSARMEYSVKTDAEFRSVQELERLVVTWVDGAPVRISDVGRVEDGAVDKESVVHFDGIPTVGVGIRKQSGANTVAVVDQVFERLAQLEPTMPPGYTLPSREKAADFSKAIREAVDETLFALVFGALLATLTVFVFLRRTRPTFIVGLAIPISLVTTFGVMWLSGYTLNTMTLLALALAVGVVVDDAIVVLENIERHREEGDEPFVAASKGTREIAFAATAATVSIAVVFLPTVFVKGIVGSFLGEFGLTVAAAVMISLVVALTLTPMLAARMPPPKERAHGSIYHRLERGFEWLDDHYRSVLGWCLSHRATTLLVALASLVVAFGFARGIGGELFPTADSGLIFTRFALPAGSRVEETAEMLAKNEAWVFEQPEVSGMFSAAGIGGRRSDNRTHLGIMFIMLHSKSERERTAQDLAPAARAALGAIPGQEVQVLDPSKMMSGAGQGGDFSFEIQGNVELEELDAASTAFVNELRKRPGFAEVHKSLKMGLPELRVIPDREKAAALGVDARSLARTVQTMIGGMDVATFKEGGERFDIRVQLEEKDRATPSAIERLYVRGSNGQLVELGNIVDVETGAAPAEITRRNRQRSVTITGALEKSDLRQAIGTARQVAAGILPEGVTFGLSGETEAFRESFSQFGFAILLAIVIIYMVLAAQFESLVHPLTVMLALPLAMVGALGALYVLYALDRAGWIQAPGMTLNLFSLIGIILLMGLATKNSILLVDYANQLRARGYSKYDAMKTAAPIRMRPVLMTAFSMIFGVMPAAIGVGPGAESRQPMAVAVAAGMFSSTVLTLLVVPVFYLVLDDGIAWLGRLARGEPRAKPAPPIESAERPEAHPALR